MSRLFPVLVDIPYTSPSPSRYYQPRILDITGGAIGFAARRTPPPPIGIDATVYGVAVGGVEGAVLAADGYYHAQYLGLPPTNQLGFGANFYADGYPQVSSARLADGYVSTSCAISVAGDFRRSTALWTMPWNSPEAMLKMGMTDWSSTSGHVPLAMFYALGVTTLSPIAPTCAITTAMASFNFDSVITTYLYGGPAKGSNSYYGIRYNDSFQYDDEELGNGWSTVVRTPVLPRLNHIALIVKGHDRVLRWYRTVEGITSVGEAGRWRYNPGDESINWLPAEHPAEVLHTITGTVMDVEESSGLVATIQGTHVRFYIDEYQIGRLHTDWPLMQFGSAPWLAANIGTVRRSNVYEKPCHLSSDQDGNLIPWLVANLRSDNNSSAFRAALVCADDAKEAAVSMFDRDVTRRQRHWR